MSSTEHDEGTEAMTTMDPETRNAFEDALEAGDRSHLLTIGSPARGLALRVTLGHISRHGAWHPRIPSAFVISDGISYYPQEIRDRARERFWHGVARWLPRRLVVAALCRAGVHATTGKFGDTVVPEVTFMEVWQRWDSR